MSGGSDCVDTLRSNRARADGLVYGDGKMLPHHLPHYRIRRIPYPGHIVSTTRNWAWPLIIRE
jgi:hypothetical protein